MQRPTPHPMVSAAVITSLGTLVSRLLGLLRDVATAALLGLSGSAAMDALVVAWRIPNLLRAVFGEGALTACFLPVFTGLHESQPRNAWRLLSVLLVWLTVVLSALVVLGEAVYAAIGLTTEDPSTRLLSVLGAILLPYAVFICAAALLTAALQALGHFATPALAPAGLNLCWMAAAGIAALVTDDRAEQAVIIALGILLSGLVQAAVQWPPLRRRGFHFDYAAADVAEPIRRVRRAMGPMLLGLAAVQIGVFWDSLLAWGLAAAPGHASTIPGTSLSYPLKQGAAAALYYGERMYQFPLGLLGLAVATAVFPLLSRHAARGDTPRLRADLSLGLRLVLALGIPAAVGLVLLAQPLTALLFERGEFTAEDSARAARMVACYSVAIWAYCALPVLVRGFYALGDTAMPARVAAVMVGLNVVLDLMLIWPLAEAGLAISTAIAAMIQVTCLAVLFARRGPGLEVGPLTATVVRSALAASAMAGVLLVILPIVPGGPWLVRAATLGLAIAAGAASYILGFTLLGGREFWHVWRRGKAEV